MENFDGNRVVAVLIIYVCLLFDNILLTVIVPILPDYLATFSKNASHIPADLLYQNIDLPYLDKRQFKNSNSHRDSISHPRIIEDDEEGKYIGMLLAVKALVQLICNPIVGNMSRIFGYKILIFSGTCFLLMSSLLYAFGESYSILFVARAVQGVGSACIGVSGMSLVAYLYPEEEKRSKVMGIVLGSVAVGVLIGYPFGGILYDFIGKSAPFFIISVFLLIDLVFQLMQFDFTLKREVESSESNQEPLKWVQLLSDKMIIAIVLAIWISTSAMAILEPCLPLWLLTELHPEKWQLGTVFIPDSVGYLIGTNFFGMISFRFGQIRTSVVALIIVGVACIVIPEARTVSSLIIPHFGLGLGIGIVDASLVPMLASIVDSKMSDDVMYPASDSSTSYGCVYAIQQTAVSLAYSIAPFLGGELTKFLGFPILMRILGVINLLYGPLLIYTTLRASLNMEVQKPTDTLLHDIRPTGYKRFYDAID